MENNFENILIPHPILDFLKNPNFNLNQTAKKFNDIFQKSGWIVTDDFSVPLMLSAIEIFEKKDLATAEEHLCNNFTEEYFKNCLRRLFALWVFKERAPLIQLAFTDHLEERYHASIPVILAQLDGLTFDIAHQSFYNDGKKSYILNHKSRTTGIESENGSISKRMNKHFDKTNSNVITFPYRNRILHGRELNYHNRIVSTKCFFILFSIRPWALYIQQNELAKRQGEKFEDIKNLKIGNKLSSFIDKLMSAE